MLKAAILSGRAPERVARCSVFIRFVVGSDDGRLYLLSLAQGKEVWSYDAGQPIESSPAVADGRVVIGVDDGAVYCFGAK